MVSRIITTTLLQPKSKKGLTDTKWKTSKELYDSLDKEFHFDFDPCPIKPYFDGLNIDWGKCNFVNPPYGKEIIHWLIKGLKEYCKGRTSVFLLPSYTDVIWFHDWVLPYSTEIRFIKGRLKFTNEKGYSDVAPFASIIVIFKP